MTKLFCLVSWPFYPIAMVGWLVWSRLLDNRSFCVWTRHMQSREYHIFCCTTKIDGVIDHQAKVWLRCPGSMGGAGHNLRQFGQVPNLPHKIRTILPRPIFFSSWPSLPNRVVCFKNTPLYCWSKIISVPHSSLRAVPKQRRWSEMWNPNEENYFCTWYLQRCPSFSSESRGTLGFQHRASWC